MNGTSLDTSDICNAPNTGATTYATSLPPTGTITATGSYTPVFTVANVPALAAGTCYFLDIRGISAQATSWALFVDSTQVLTIFSPSTVEDDRLEIAYCNATGSQVSQNIYQKMGGIQAPPTGSPASVTPFDFIGDAPSLTNVNWAVSHTVSLQANAASGSMQGLYFRIGL